VIVGAAEADADAPVEGASIARVVLDTPLPQLDRLLDYRIPPGLEGVVPGVRVTVPLRSANRMTQGFVVDPRTG